MPRRPRLPFKAASAFLGLNATMGAMIVVVVLVGLGEKMAERYLPLYVVALGGTALAVAALNALDVFLGALYSLAGGWASDRLGFRRALVAFTALAMAGYVVVILIPDWRAVLAGSALFIAWTAISLPAVMSLVASSVPPERRTMGTTVHSFVRRIPMALGPLLGGVLIASLGERRGLQIAFAAAFVLGGIAIAAVLRWMPEPEAAKKAKPRILDGFAGLRGKLAVLLVSDILVRFAEQIPYPFVVVWVVTNQGQGAERFGVLTAVEMATAMAVYLPVAYFADRGRKKPFVAATFAFFAAFPLMLLGASSFWALCVAFVVRGLKEFGEPTRKALISELAPDGLRAATFGAYYLVRDLIVSIAALGAGLLWAASPAVAFLAAFGFGCAGFLVYVLFGKDASGD